VALLWKKQYIPLILTGAKTATRRRRKPPVKEGGSYHIRTGFFEHLDDRFRVDRLYQQRLGDMTEDDASREGSPTLRDYARDWIALYGAWNPDDLVWVVEFHLEVPNGNI
jgi:hypothetical protein